LARPRRPVHAAACRRELEFSSKGTARLRGIVEAYAASNYDEVRYVVSSLVLARRIASFAEPASLLHLGGPTPIVVVAWIETPKTVADRIGRLNGLPG
jgi:hypothetical protein